MFRSSSYANPNLVSKVTDAVFSGSYQWIVCGNNLPIASETNQDFTATVNGNYAYSIKTTEDPIEFLDPLNLDEVYKVAGQEIWFKYTSLRTKNRCDKARPVSIVEMKVRGK